MKTLCRKLSERITNTKQILTAACLFAGVLTSSATVTPQGWWHYGEVPDYYADSSGHAYRFQSAFSRVGSGNAGAGVEPFGCGGPLGDTGFSSTSCLYWTPTHADAAGMWDPGNTAVPSYNPPASNYVIELWCLPTYPGTLGGNGAWLFCSGTGGGATFVLTNDGAGNMTLNAKIVPLTTSSQIGDSWVVDTNRWTHLAIVNDNGTNTFYVNGVQHGAPADPSVSTAPGTIYAGSASGTQPTYEGYLDELRISTFAANQFSTTDLLTRAMSPDITSQPPPETVWNGGAAPFTVGVAIDTSTTYQWQNAGVSIDGATNSELYLNTVTTASNNAQFSCVLNNYTGIAVTSAVTTLTVVSPNAANVSAYRTAVTSESGLVAYYTVDNDTGTTLTDTKGSDNGTLEGTAEYDGRTNYAFGVRALRFRNSDDGDVTIPNNPAFEFASGTGTIEAIVHLDQALSPTNETIFAEGFAENPVYYAIQVSPDGSSLIYTNDSLTKAITWAVPVPILGRLAHVAVVFTNSTVTAYADGLSLGTQANPSFGSLPGGAAWIGSAGGLAEPGEFTGSIDEVAIYTSALSANAIAIHNSKFIFGTNTTSPSITASPSGSKTLLAGGLASFSVTATGTAPLSYQWTTNNGVPIPGATGATLTLSPSTTNQTGTYGVTVSNPYGSTNSSTFNLTFVAPTDRYGTIVMGDNPMAYWRLDETNGTTAFDSAGGHDGTYSGSLTLGEAGALPGDSDTAVHFSGGHVQVPYTPILNPGSAFTVEFWANTDLNALAVGATYVPMGSQFRNGGGRDGWAFYDNNDGNGWELQMGDPSGVSHYAYGNADAVGDYWYYVAAIWDGTNTLSLYAENQLVGQNTQVQNGGVYVPNPSQPLIIGNRNDFNFPFLGLMDEVAIYNYALTTNQISNHWSIKFVASQITQQPLGVTNSEGSTITLTAAASGFPNTYQWFFDGTPLAAAANFDGTAHYPNGVNSASLVIAEAKPADSGEYFLGVTNGLGDSVSSNATVLITANTNPPSVVSVTALGTVNMSGGSATNPYLVKVVFSARVDASTGGTAANYTFTPPVTINQMTLLGSGANDLAATSLGADWREAILDTAGLAPGQQYSLKVSGVKDQSQTPLTMPTTNLTFRAPVVAAGVVDWDYYYLATVGNPPVVSALTGDVNYPNAPQTNSLLTALDTDQITHGDLNNVSPFGALGDNYGDVVSGWITPTVSGSYTFFLWTDDPGELDLSSDSTPGNLSPIASELNAGGGFTEPTNSVDNDSSPITLVAGKAYFFRLLHTEGGGGDYAKVAWRISTDSTPAANLTPIPGAYLSGYSSVAAPQFSAPGLTNGVLTLNWSGSGATIQESTNLINWADVPGNPDPLVIPVNSGTNALFFRLSQ